MMAEDELERFRREWQEEVQRNRGAGSFGSSAVAQAPDRPAGRRDSRAGASEKLHQPSTSSAKQNDDNQVAEGYDFDDLEEREKSRMLGESGTGKHPESQAVKEPQTALEHYEKAVQREKEGALGDSLALYRKAFKLDERVDQVYKNKHFPPTTKPSQGSQKLGVQARRYSNDAVAPHISDLLASFSSAKILGADLIIAGDTPPPCPMATIPSEILANILLNVAITDIATYARLSLVCRRLAHVVATEDKIWRRVCYGAEFGFGGMHHKYCRTLSGALITDDTLGISDLSLDDSNEGKEITRNDSDVTHIPLTPEYPSYLSMFRHRPRIRFAGVYISTVNYIRPGASSPSQLTWNSPVHIVTYYRYLRFLRDGSCISLLSVVEPHEVVPYLVPENVSTPEAKTSRHRHKNSLHGSNFAVSGVSGNMQSGGIYTNAGGPSNAASAATAPAISAGHIAVTKHAQRGRWRISPLQRLDSEESDTTVDEDNGETAEEEKKQQQEPEGDITIETYGPSPAYIFKMEMALRSSGGSRVVQGPRNTKLMWRGFWSYNKVTDDWAEFGLKNDKPFVWSRVKSWADM